LRHNRFRRILDRLISSTRSVFAITSILIAALLVDISLVKIYNLAGTSITEILIATFVLIASTFVIGQYIIFGLANNRVKQSKPGCTVSNMIHKSVRISQYCISGFVVMIMFEIFFTSRYHTFILETVMTISYGSSIITLGLLAQRLFSWFKSRNRVLSFHSRKEVYQLHLFAKYDQSSNVHLFLCLLAYAHQCSRSKRSR
jgi:hypothetical protein